MYLHRIMKLHQISYGQEDRQILLIGTVVLFTLLVIDRQSRQRQTSSESCLLSVFKNQKGLKKAYLKS